MKSKKNLQPLVSVVMPVYNAGNFLENSIKSIINQTYSNLELIIVNDASTDKSLEIIKKFKKKYPEKIKIINLKKTLNRGGDACANIGIKKAKGKYIARMDADDIAYPQRLEKQIKFLEKNPHVFLVGSQADVIDKNGNIIGEKKVPEKSDEIKNNYFTFHPIIHPTVVFRKNFRGKKFFYQIKYSANNDYYTFFKLISQGVFFYNLPEKLLKYRIHGKNDTFSNIKIKYLNTLKIRLEIIKKYHYFPTIEQFGIIFFQTLIFFILPSKILIYIYLITRGVVKPLDQIKKMWDKLNFIFFAIKKIAIS